MVTLLSQQRQTPLLPLIDASSLTDSQDDIAAKFEAEAKLDAQRRSKQLNSAVASAEILFSTYLKELVRDQISGNESVGKIQEILTHLQRFNWPEGTKLPELEGKSAMEVKMERTNSELLKLRKENESLKTWQKEQMERTSSIEAKLATLMGQQSIPQHPAASISSTAPLPPSLPPSSAEQAALSTEVSEIKIKLDKLNQFVGIDLTNGNSTEEGELSDDDQPMNGKKRDSGFKESNGTVSSDSHNLESRLSKMEQNTSVSILGLFQSISSCSS